MRSISSISWQSDLACWVSLLQMLNLGPHQCFFLVQPAEEGGLPGRELVLTHCQHWRLPGELPLEEMCQRATRSSAQSLQGDRGWILSLSLWFCIRVSGHHNASVEVRGYSVKLSSLPPLYSGSGEQTQAARLERQARLHPQSHLASIPQALFLWSFTLIEKS